MIVGGTMRGARGIVARTITRSVGAILKRQSVEQIPCRTGDEEYCNHSNLSVIGHRIGLKAFSMCKTECYIQAQRRAIISATLELTTLYDKNRDRRKTNHPRSARDYFEAVNEDERFRKRILKAILPILRKEIYNMNHSKEAISATIAKELARSANTMSDALSNKWISANPQRERFVPSDACPLPDRLRAGYVNEGMEIYEDTYDYIEAVAMSR